MSLIKTGGINMSSTTSIRYFFAKLNIAERLIAANVAIYIVNSLLVFLFQLHKFSFIQWFELPRSFTDFIGQPWSLVTYAFFHNDFFHIFWNMILLYFTGKIFLNLFNERRFIAVYFLGAIVGGLLFLISYNLFPVFSGINTALIGASAAVMAILLCICAYIPNQDIRVFFFNIKLWHLGAFFVLLDLIQLPFNNPGGHIAHLGGAALGYFYARQLSNGNDIGEWFSRLLDSFRSIFTPKKRSPLKTVYKKNTTVKTPVKEKKSEEQLKIDEILDKISKSGYDSLTREEKDFLFKVGKS